MEAAGILIGGSGPVASPSSAANAVAKVRHAAFPLQNLDELQISRLRAQMLEQPPPITQQHRHQVNLDLVQDPVPQRTHGKAAAPARSKAGATRPRRLSHVLLFTSDVMRSVTFYRDALGLRLSDHSGEGIAFMHGAHGSDHHMLAFAKSDGPGLHHSSWDVTDVDAVGIGMEQMGAAGYTEGWGVGRHVIGSNYFRYVRDPWGSFAEYSAGIDFIPADLEWPVGDHPPEDSFYVWGPPVPDYFIQNHETAVRRQHP